MPRHKDGFVSHCLGNFPTAITYVLWHRPGAPVTLPSSYMFIQPVLSTFGRNERNWKSLRRLQLLLTQGSQVCSQMSNFARVVVRLGLVWFCLRLPVLTAVHRAENRHLQY